MMVRTSLVVGSVWFAAICFADPARAQTYVWQRSQETVESRSKAKWTLQEVEDNADPDHDIGSDGYAISKLTGVGGTKPVFGGNGGDGASNLGPGADGADGDGGDDAAAMDGAPGASPQAQGGEGGQAGENGEATAGINANGIVELNPDGQTVLSWSYIHNQDADLLLRGAGGGGGGGGGGDAFFFEGTHPGGDGGDGGGGQAARGQLHCTQTSGADVIAVFSRGPDADGNTPNTTTARVRVDLGWTSTGTETGADVFDSPDEAWERHVHITITLGDATLMIEGGPTGPIHAWGTSDNGPFEKWSVDSLEDANGSFGIDLSEFPVTLDVGDEVSIVTTPGDDDTDDTDDDVASTLQVQDTNSLDGNMDAPAGGGASGGGEFDGSDGIDGGYTGNTLGAGGGDGGAGGLGFQNAGDGHLGGAGGTGHENRTQRNGLFQGVVEIHLDQ